MRKQLARFTLKTVLLCAVVTTSAVCYAETEDGQPASAEEKEDKTDELKAISDIAEKCSRLDGLFTLLRDRSTGELYLQIDESQLGKEFIYFTYTESGVGGLGHFRGNFRDRRVFSIERDHQRLRFVFKPVRYHFDPQHPLHRSADANVSPAVVAAPKIVARDEEAGQYLIQADELFLKEVFHQVKSSSRPDDKSKKQFGLGKLNEDKTRYATIRNYPQNTDLVIEYVYQNLAPTAHAQRGQGVTDSRYVSIKLQHSLIAMPENDYQPRRDDPRVGYFMQQIDDMTSTSATPYRDVITRWHLKKKDAQAKLSEPVEPITWWIENTTPMEFREVIRDAGLAWNEAFEHAGFRNAVAVKVQPDDSPWDAGDLRYNVLRWTSSPDPQFGGYGPSFINPRTGQILGADIMLEWVFVTNRVRFGRLFDNGHSTWNGLSPKCELGHDLHASTLFGVRALRATGAGDVDVDRLMKQSLYFLVLHEIGHTLGLSHNMKSSQLHPFTEIHNAAVTEPVGLTGSVMDYPAINIAPPGTPQGQYYTTKPGPYDKWAIEYGYSPGLDNAHAEQKRLQEILSRSTEPEMTFGNDADDMRYPGRGIDPRVMINDMSRDAIAYAEERMQMVNHLLGQLRVRIVEPQASYQELRDGYFLSLRQHRSAAAAVSRYIGGLYVDRAWAGQLGATQPFTPVSRADQKRAMRVLADHVFGPAAFSFPADLLAHAQPQRRGFNHFSENEDLQIHEDVLDIQKRVLDHLLNDKVRHRITDTRLYGNRYPVTELFDDLTNAIFDGDANGSVNTFRQNLQTEYVQRIIKIPKDETSSDFVSQAAAVHQLREIRRDLEKMSTDEVDSETKVHREYLRFLIDRALNTKE